jgi:hypothetical protein
MHERIILRMKQKMLTLLIVFPLFSFTCGGSPCPITENTDINEAVACLKSLPKEDILLVPEVKEYLSKHKVYISLTTSPLRISKILPVLQTLDLEFVENILLVLPKKFSRDGSEYVIPEEIKNFPKVKILRIGSDLGPITKLLPAIVYVNHSAKNKEAGIVITTEGPVLTPDPSSDPDAIVITVDDDTGYSNGSISQLIKYTILEDAVIGRSAVNIPFYNINASSWPKEETTISKTGQATSRDIVEGFAGVAYKARYVDVKLMKEINSISALCRAADDLVINIVLANKSVPRFKINNDYIGWPLQFKFGFQKDALHNGAGSDGLEGAHSRNYPQCAESANSNLGN